MSDRQLADLAFERETVADRLDAARSAKPVETAAGGHVARWFAAHREERRIRRELGAYSDADLLDLGIGRGDIAAVARGEPVLTFRDAGTVDRHFAAGTVPTAANRPARRRVA
ncbi:MAG: DUF1127 domain-containing protein [Inquilinus sp.]|nr:DUF1127 domain-containing protein [Inquilinus sp.]